PGADAELVLHHRHDRAVHHPLDLRGDPALGPGGRPEPAAGPRAAHRRRRPAAAANRSGARIAGLLPLRHGVAPAAPRSRGPGRVTAPLDAAGLPAADMPPPHRTPGRLGGWSFNVGIV